MLVDWEDIGITFLIAIVLLIPSAIVWKVIPVLGFKYALILINGLIVFFMTLKMASPFFFLRRKYKKLMETKNKAFVEFVAAKIIGRVFRVKESDYSILLNGSLGLVLMAILLSIFKIDNKGDSIVRASFFLGTALFLTISFLILYYLMVRKIILLLGNGFILEILNRDESLAKEIRHHQAKKLEGYRKGMSDPEIKSFCEQKKLEELKSYQNRQMTLTIQITHNEELERRKVGEEGWSAKTEIYKVRAKVSINSLEVPLAPEGDKMVSIRCSGCGKTYETLVFPWKKGMRRYITRLLLSALPLLALILSTIFIWVIPNADPGEVTGGGLVIAYLIFGIIFFYFFRNFGGAFCRDIDSKEYYHSFEITVVPTNFILEFFQP